MAAAGCERGPDGGEVNIDGRPVGGRRGFGKRRGGFGGGKKKKRNKWNLLRRSFLNGTKAETRAATITRPRQVFAEAERRKSD